MTTLFQDMISEDPINAHVEYVRTDKIEYDDFSVPYRHFYKNRLLQINTKKFY